MNKNLKNLVTAICFVTILFGFVFANFLTADKEVSFSERRKLNQLPVFSFSDLIFDDYFEKTESYHLDQFFGRDFFRSVKAYFKKYIALQSDNNGIYIDDGILYKLGDDLDEESVKAAAQKMNYISEYFNDCNIFYCIVPNKNYYSNSKFYPKLDYNLLMYLLNENISDMTFIEIQNLLTIADFYKTDLHWSQDRILPVADHILIAMGCGEISYLPYSVTELSPFYGSYYGQAALGGEADTLIYIYNDMINSLTLYDFETDETSCVYDETLINSVDGYSVFLKGAKPLLRIDNPLIQNGKTLYLFRDSLSSCLAPLLAQEYQIIYLIDLRYITTEKLVEYIPFETSSDVLFLFGSDLINKSELFLD